MLLSFTSSGGDRWIEATSFQSKGGWWQGKCHDTFQRVLCCLCHLNDREGSGEDENHWEHPFSYSSSPAGTAQPNTMVTPAFYTARSSRGLVHGSSHSSGVPGGYSGGNHKILYCQINKSPKCLDGHSLCLTLSPLAAATGWGRAGRWLPGSSAWLGRGVFPLQQNFVPWWSQLPHPFVSFRILLAALLPFPSPYSGSAITNAVPSAASSVLPPPPGLSRGLMKLA